MENRETETRFPSREIWIPIEGVPYNHRRDAMHGISGLPRRHQKTPKKASESPFDWNICSATLDDKNQASV